MLFYIVGIILVIASIGFGLSFIPTKSWKEYLAPEGSITIVANGTFDVKEKAEVVVNVENKIPDGKCRRAEINLIQVKTQTRHLLFDPEGDIQHLFEGILHRVINSTEIYL